MPTKVASKAAKKAAGQAPQDDGESVHLIEPMRISEDNDARPELTELVLGLTKPPRLA